MTPFDDFVRLVEVRTGRPGVKRGKNIRTLCPAHDDHEPSLDIAPGEMGQPMTQCRSRGCSFGDIARAIGWETASSPAYQGATTQPPGQCALEDYARAKHLPVQFLLSIGVSEINYFGGPALRIPFHSPSGEEVAVQRRLQLGSSSITTGVRFNWTKGSKLCMYGLDRLAAAREAGHVLIVEGCSDCHVGWFHGVPVLGLPGANHYRDERDAPHLEGIADIFVIWEPDEGGEALLRALRRSSIRDRVRVVTLNSVKDIADLHITNPGRFSEMLQAALDQSMPLIEFDRRQSADQAAETRSTTWEACASIAREPRILDQVSSALSGRGVVGERCLTQIIYLAVTSRLLDRPISIAVKGPSSAGKSHTVEKTLELFPPEAVYALSAMSDRALAYSEEPLKHRTLVIYEAAGMGSDFASYMVRSLLSEGRIRYETVDKTEGGLTARLIEREGPTGLIVTTTATSLHPENETRLLSVTATDTPEQTAAILAALAVESVGTDRTELERWHALQRWLAAGPANVNVPYALELAKMIPPIAVRLRRDFRQVLALVRAHALLHQASRTVDEKGRIVAEVEDYQVVRELVIDIVSQGIGAAVSESTRETVAAVPPGDIGVPVKHVADALKLDKSTALRRVRLALEAGYLENVAERRKGVAHRLVRGAPIPDDVEILPHAERLRGCVAAGGGAALAPADEMAETLRVELGAEEIPAFEAGEHHRA